MRFHTRKWVKPEDLNANDTLFGGKVLAWIDEEAALYSIIQLESKKVVTKYISEINFMSSAKEGDIIEIGIEVVKFGHTSITLNCEVRNKMTRESIVTVDNIIMVNLDVNGNPTPHGKTKIEYVKDRLAKKAKEEQQEKVV
nr:hotdog domain-containing protein [Allomuricauda sp.]